MKNSTLFLISFIVVHFSNAQQTSQTTKDFFNYGGSGLSPNKVLGVSNISGGGGRIIGDTYLDSSFQLTTLKLYQKIGPPGRESDSIPMVKARYDIHNREFELMAAPDDVRGLKGNRVRFFMAEAKGSIAPKVYINVHEFSYDESFDGFAEILNGGKNAILLLSSKVGFSKPTYNEALGTGTKDVKVIKLQQFYIAKKNVLYKLNNSKKKVIEALSDKEEQIESFIESNNLDTKEINDLVRVFEYYNSL